MTMLTLLETTNAINALPTEPDIIRQACVKIIAPVACTKLSATQEIMLKLTHESTEDKFAIAIEVLAYVMAITVEDYRDLSLLKSVEKHLRSAFLAARATLLIATRGIDAAEAYIQKTEDSAMADVKAATKKDRKNARLRIASR